MKIFAFLKKKPYFLLLIPGLFLFLSIALATFFSSPPEKLRPLPSSKIQESPPVLPEKVLPGKIEKGQNLSTALHAQGLAADLVESICRQLSTVVNLRRMKPGDRFEVRSTLEGNFLSFTFQTSPVDIYQTTLNQLGEWATQKKEIPVEKYWARVSGEISSSLFEAMDAQGEQDPLVLDFVDIFAWEIDFHSDLQKGDRFQLVVEKYYADGNFVRYGRILCATYESANRLSQGIFFDPSGQAGGYYRSQGDSLRKVLLRSPLKFTRISSGYSKSRKHPIFGDRRPHYGIDYAAPEGSPVVAIGDGTVIACGLNGGFGKQVTLRHANGYESAYGHLSRFAPGIQKGKRVQQKQVIGYVGSTGLATGPHLDFRLRKNKAFVNPLRVVQPPAAPLKPEQMPDFKEATDPVLRWMQEASGSNSQKVASLTSKDFEQPKNRWK